MIERRGEKSTTHTDRGIERREEDVRRRMRAERRVESIERAQRAKSRSRVENEENTW